MKNLYPLLVFLITLTISAQAPQGLNYQATVRNNAGALMINKNVTFKFNVMKDTPTSVPVFSETHYVPTDDLGAVNLVIGKGTATTGTFATINWGTGNYYLGIELNTGTGYVAMGTTQLLSVPYALYANSSGNTQAATPNLASVLAVNNGANNLQIKNLADPTEAQDAVTKGFLATQIAALQAQITALQNANVAQLPNVTIGTQIWSTNNLDATTYRDGTPIPQVTDPTQWENLTTGAWCYYNNDPANGAIYGKLYNWYAVAGIHANDPNTPNKILAPQGWHVFSRDDWNILESVLGNGQVIGGKLKATGTSFWQAPNTDATNESGITALPAGIRNGTFRDISLKAYWWCSTEYNIMEAQYFHLNYDNGFAGNSSMGKDRGMSVRLVKD